MAWKKKSKIYCVKDEKKKKQVDAFFQRFQMYIPSCYYVIDYARLATPVKFYSKY